MKHAILTGFAFLPKEVIDLNRPYTCCRICGAVFQSRVDTYSGTYPTRLPMTVNSEMERVFIAMTMRKKWSQQHANTHSDEEHLKLAKSGMWCTPEAAEILSSYGVIALSDMVLYDDTQDALRKASPIPIKEVESVLRGYL